MTKMANGDAIQPKQHTANTARNTRAQSKAMSNAGRHGLAERLSNGFARVFASALRSATRSAATEPVLFIEVPGPITLDGEDWPAKRPPQREVAASVAMVADALGGASVFRIFSGSSIALNARVLPGGRGSNGVAQRSSLRRLAGQCNEQAHGIVGAVERHKKMIVVVRRYRVACDTGIRQHRTHGGKKAHRGEIRVNGQGDHPGLERIVHAAAFRARFFDDRGQAFGFLKLTDRITAIGQL